MSQQEDAYRRYARAAMNLAICVEVTARIAEDPNYIADRSPRADRLREERRIADIQEFRAAQEEYEALVSVWLWERAARGDS